MPACDEGCNEAEYQLVNGEEVQHLCGPSFAEALVGLVRGNEWLNLRMDREGGIVRVVLY